MKKYDVVIIGSGIGGLVCGCILGMEGYSVCMIEKNRQTGGCLQSYSKDKVLFDAGVHYIGGLGQGQNLYQIFKYLGIMDELHLQKMDENAFDKIIIENDENEYPLAQGYENFIKRLLTFFHEEEQALRMYCHKIKEVCKKFPLYNLRFEEGLDEKFSVMDLDAKNFIDSITSNKKLRAVLSGNNILYAGEPNQTPFYIHALIMNSYIESSWKCTNGGQQIAGLLSNKIKKHGGEFFTGKEVKKIVEENGQVTHVELSDGLRIYATNFISNIHPAKTVQITQTNLLRNIYRKRLSGLKNTVSAFVLNIVLKKNFLKYSNSNYYFHKEGQVWNMVNYTEENWPLGYAVFFSSSSPSQKYAESITVITYMQFDEVKKWQHTFNTKAVNKSRGEDYEQFKKQKAEILLDNIETKFPELRNGIQSYYAATPLTFRDYTGNDDGSLYGIAKNYSNPLKTFLSTKTKLPNLYLTGQNLNVHGILGTVISGLITCFEMLNNNGIIKKIKNA